MAEYYKANELTEKPFIFWEMVAADDIQLENLGFKNDPLVVPEGEIPTLQYGVYPWKISGGELVDRTPSEMSNYQLQYQNENPVRLQANKIAKINSASFEYNAVNFPMNEVARLHYSVVERLPQNHKVLSYTGIYSLLEEDRASFISAYYFELEKLIQ
jgi:hypothetical protein